MAHHRRGHLLHVSLGHRIRNSGLGPHSTRQRLLGPHKTGGQVRLRLVGRGNFCGDVRDPCSYQHAPRRCCPWCGSATIFQAWYAAEFILGAVGTLHSWRSVSNLESVDMTSPHEFF